MVRDVKISDEIVGGHLGEIIKDCCRNSLKKSFADVMEKHFNKENPFQANETKGEFFSCGFLTNTNIFVVDSVVPEVYVKMLCCLLQDLFVSVIF